MNKIKSHKDSKVVLNSTDGKKFSLKVGQLID